MPENGVIDPLAGAAAEIDEALQKDKQAIANMGKAESASFDAARSAANSVKSSIDSAKEAEAQAEAYNAEEQASQRGRIISVEEALALIDQESKARSQARKLEAQSLSEAVQYAGAAIANGATMTMDNADSLLAGFGAASTDKASIGAGIAAFGANLIFRTAAGKNAAEAGAESFSELQASNESDEDEKFVGDVTTAEAQAEYVAEHINGEAAGSKYDEQEEAEEKPLPVPDGYEAEKNTDAMDLSPDELDELADVDMVASGEAMTGKGLESWLDAASEMLRDVAPEGAVGLAASVAEKGVVGAALEAAPKVGAALAKLREMNAETDRNAAEQEQQASQGPEYP